MQPSERYDLQGPVRRAHSLASPAAGRAPLRHEAKHPAPQGRCPLESASGRLATHTAHE